VVLIAILVVFILPYYSATNGRHSVEIRRADWSDPASGAKIGRHSFQLWPPFVPASAAVLCHVAEGEGDVLYIYRFLCVSAFRLCLFYAGTSRIARVKLGCEEESGIAAVPTLYAKMNLTSSPFRSTPFIRVRSSRTRGASNSSMNYAQPMRSQPR
jgi:hypothetical protein